MPKNREPISFEAAGDTKRYLIEGDPYDRVTSLLSAGTPMPWLAPWAAKMTAEAAVYESDEWLGIQQDEGTEAAIRWLKEARNRIRDGAGRLGSAVHKAAEAYLADETPLDEFDPEMAAALAEYPQGGEMVAHVHQIIDEVLPPSAWHTVEGVVYSPTVGYAGTFDGLVRIPDTEEGRGLRLSMGMLPDDDRLVMVDWKTSKNLGSGYGLQMASYRHADYRIEVDGEGQAWRVPNDPDEIAPTALLLHVRAEGWRIVTADVSGDTYRGFLSTVGVARFARGESPVSKGAILSG